MKFLRVALIAFLVTAAMGCHMMHHGHHSMDNHKCGCDDHASGACGCSDSASCGEKGHSCDKGCSHHIGHDTSSCGCGAH